MRTVPSEGWILAGTLDGTRAAPGLLEDVAGLPYALRLACDLAIAGVRRIVLVWVGPGEPPDLGEVTRDPRLASRAELSIATTPPAGDAGDAIVVLSADRIYHRDLPKQAIAAWRDAAPAGPAGPAAVAVVDGDPLDTVLVTDRATARRLVEAAPTPGGLAGVRAALAPIRAALPYLGFSMAAPDRRALRRAERRLVWSLRKAADGVAAKLLNRRLSLPITWLLMRTRVHPNHSTIVAFLCALAGGITIARGGYLAGVVGLLLVEVGSIIDGIDGELARLKYQFSKTGQWLDTVGDDLATIAYVTGAIVNLDMAGVGWAAPLGVPAMCAFAITQSTQYFLITRVYKSGDLAAIPWAFQSTEFLSARPTGVVANVRATIPKLLKRDFAVTLFFVLALLGRLDVVLAVSAGGALTFFVVFWIQLVRNRGAIQAARAARSAA